MATESTDSKEITGIDCKEWTAMLLCPCMHCCKPELARRDCCLCCQEKDFNDANILSPFIEMAGTLVPGNPLPIWFLILRTILTIILVYIWFFGFIWYAVRGFAAYYFIYFTIWTHTSCTICMIVKTISSWIIYTKVRKDDGFDVNKPIDNTHPLWKLYIAQSLLVQLTTPAIGMLVLNYFAFVFDGKFASAVAGVNSMQLHAVNAVLVMTDFFLSAQRMYYKAAYWCILYGTLYTLWTFIFEVAIRYTETGRSYIYSAYDWRKDLDGDGDDDNNYAPIAYYVGSAVILSVFALIITPLKNWLLIRFHVMKAEENKVQMTQTSV